MSKILLVEDDNNLREIYEARLQAEGYTIVSAHDGEEALVIAKAEKPNLIISDVMMPKISGFEMLDILRNTDGLKDVKIIMLTALGQSEDQLRANKLGADRYLVKSQVTLEDIVKSTHELLEDGVTEVQSAESIPVILATSAVPIVAPQTDVIVPEIISPTNEVSLPTSVIVDPDLAETTSQEQSEVKAEIQQFENNISTAAPIQVEVTDSINPGPDDIQPVIPATEPMDNLDLPGVVGLTTEASKESTTEVSSLNDLDSKAMDDAISGIMSASDPEPSESPAVQPTDTVAIVPVMPEIPQTTFDTLPTATSVSPLLTVSVPAAVDTVTPTPTPDVATQSSETKPPINLSQIAL